MRGASRCIQRSQGHVRPILEAVKVLTDKPVTPVENVKAGHQCRLAVTQEWEVMPVIGLMMGMGFATTSLRTGAGVARNVPD